MDERLNNFDLLRLVAAFQVVYFHVINNLGVEAPWIFTPLTEVMKLFPGVPVFFVISGYLISLSYERNHTLRTYFVNRFLRIFPGLWVCFASLLLAITITAGWDRITLDASTFLTWVAMQVSIGQFWAPFEIKTTWGVGHPNGSLWTIPVELQFYLLIPILYLGLFRLSRAQSNVFLVVLIAVFTVLQRGYLHYRPMLAEDYETINALVRVTFVPWVYMFLIGVLLQRNRTFLLPLLRQRGLGFLVTYIVLAFVANQFGATSGNYISPLLSPILAVTIISLAYTGQDLSQRILRGNDISYGVYIYHMVVVNTLVELGARGTAWGATAAYVLTGAAAWTSWKLVEQPALRLKRFALRPVKDAAKTRP